MRKLILLTALVFGVTVITYSQTIPTPNIRLAQQTLTWLEYAPGAVDGRWGNKTELAVRQFQTAEHLSVSGQLDSATYTLLLQRKAEFVPETKSLLHHLPEGAPELDAKVAFLSDPKNSHRLGVALSVSKKGEGKIPSPFRFFYPKVIFEFGEEAYVPAAGLKRDLSVQADGTLGRVGEFTSSPGSPYADQITVPDYVTLSYVHTIPSKSLLYKFSHAKEDELKFKMTAWGLRYISGKGSVRTPAGKIYSFPVK